MSEFFETNAIRNQLERTQHSEHSAPIFLTSSFIFEDAEEMRAMFAGEIDGNIYSRYSNPNTDELIRKVCVMEGCEDGIATASGMAAIFASMMSVLKSGDHVIACRAVFGSTHQILTQLFPRWGITYTYVDAMDTKAWDKAVQANSKMFLFETPSNPSLQLIDLEFVGKFCKKHHLIYNVDNCFATPYLQQPAQYGADLVIHSATKYMDGQGRVLGGLILGKKELIEHVRFFIRHTGPALSPFNAWVLSKSLETLAVRMERHCSNALALAQHFEQHPEIEKVIYPFLKSHPQYKLAKKQMKLGGAIVSLEVKGGVERGRKFLDAIKMLSLSSNLGDTRSIVTHPASSTHSKLSEQERLDVGITAGLVRVSVGLEHIQDIIADIEQALGASK